MVKGIECKEVKKMKLQLNERPRKNFIQINTWGHSKVDSHTSEVKNLFVFLTFFYWTGITPESSSLSLLSPGIIYYLFENCKSIVTSESSKN